MQVCTNCGEERKGNEKFCVSCGTVFNERKNPEEPKLSNKKEVRKQKISSGQMKKRLAGIISIAVILLGFVGAHLYISSTLEPSSTLRAMNQAFSSGDETAFLGYFTVGEDVNKDEEGFYSFIENEGWEDIRNNMKTESDRLSAEGLSNIILDSQGNKLISVLDEPKFGGLYSQVSFMVHPVKLSVDMPVDNMKFVVGDSELSGNQGDQVVAGEFLPGVYEWEANMESEISPIKEIGKLNTYSANKNSAVYEPSLEVGMVKISSDLPEAILWINGESTKKTIKEMNSIGPVKMDGSVEITAEGKNESGETVKGEPMSIESDSIHVAFAHVQEKIASERDRKTEERKLLQLADEHVYDVSYFIDEFRYSFESALNYADFSYIADYFPTGSEIQKEYITKMEEHGNLENYYNYAFQSTTVTGFEVIDETTFEATTAEMFYFDLPDDSLRYNNTKVYTIILLNNRYYIQEIVLLTSENVSVY